MNPFWSETFPPTKKGIALLGLFSSRTSELSDFCCRGCVSYWPRRNRSRQVDGSMTFIPNGRTRGPHGWRQATRVRQFTVFYLFLCGPIIKINALERKKSPGRRSKGQKNGLLLPRPLVHNRFDSSPWGGSGAWTTREFFLRTERGRVDSTLQQSALSDGSAGTTGPSADYRLHEHCRRLLK